MRQTKDGQRLVVHLFNDLNTTAHHALPADDVPLREETVPIHDIGVRFDPQLSPGPGSPGARGPGARDDRDAPRAIRVIVPKLDVHAMVVAELAEYAGAVADSGERVHLPIGQSRCGGCSRPV